MEKRNVRKIYLAIACWLAMAGVTAALISANFPEQATAQAAAAVTRTDVPNNSDVGCDIPTSIPGNPKPVSKGSRPECGWDPSRNECRGHCGAHGTRCKPTGNPYECTCQPR